MKDNVINWGILAAIFICSIVAITHHYYSVEDAKIVSLVESGIDPIEARYTITGRGINLVNVLLIHKANRKAE